MQSTVELSLKDRVVKSDLDAHKQWQILKSSIVCIFCFYSAKRTYFIYQKVFQLYFFNRKVLLWNGNNLKQKWLLTGKLIHLYVYITMYASTKSHIQSNIYIYDIKWCIPTSFIKISTDLRYKCFWNIIKSLIH